MSMKARILAAVDLKRKTIPVPEWGFDVTLQQLSAAQADELGAIQMDATIPSSMARLQKFGEYLLCNSIIEPDTGAQAFTVDDLPELKKKSPSATALIIAEAMALNGYGIKLEEAEVKNSGAGTTGDSPSVSA